MSGADQRRNRADNRLQSWLSSLSEMERSYDDCVDFWLGMMSIVLIELYSCFVSTDV